MSYTSSFFFTFTPCQEVLSHCREQSSKGKSMESSRDRRHGKENIFGAMCCRSKTWQSHDQRHLIILELHCSFNPSERTIFYWGEGEGHNAGVGNWARMAVTSCWKCILLNVAGTFEGDGEDDSIKPPCVCGEWGAELMGLETQMCHKSLSTQHSIVHLFFSWGLGKLVRWMWPDYNILHLAYRNREQVMQCLG